MKSKDILNSLVLGGSGGSSPAPSGSVTFTQNGTYDVSDKAEAVVNVPAPTPSGSVTITENGTYDVSGKAQAVVDVPSGPSGGLSYNELFGGNSDIEIVLTDEDSGKYGGKFYIPNNFGVGTVNTGPLRNAIPFRERIKGLSAIFTNLGSALNIGVSSFSGCINFTDLMLYAPTPCINIYEKAFLGCTGLSGDLDLSSVINLDVNAFKNCTQITSITTSATIINASAFDSCLALGKAYLNNGTRLYNGVFYYCSSLIALVLRDETVSSLLNTNALSGTPIASGTGYIYVPASVIDAYKEASNWITYANQFRALEDYTVDGTRTGALDPEKI